MHVEVKGKIYRRKKCALCLFTRPSLSVFLSSSSRSKRISGRATRKKKKHTQYYSIISRVPITFLLPIFSPSRAVCCEWSVNGRENAQHLTIFHTEFYYEIRILLRGSMKRGHATGSTTVNSDSSLVRGPRRAAKLYKRTFLW